VWLRPGLALSMLADQTDKLAVTCWANETRLVRASARFTALLRVDVIHRDPVAHAMGSPLPGMLPDDTVSSVAPTSPGMPPIGGLSLADVPDAVVGARETSRPRPARFRSGRCCRSSNRYTSAFGMPGWVTMVIETS
jgi:hypothetical protein